MRSVITHRVIAGTLVVVSLVGISTASAQIPDEFTNLQVLPKDTSKRELVSVMREFAGALGVRCNFCHVGENPNSLEGYDFASDEPKPKKTAREMMKMAGQINDTVLPAAGVDARVRCVTCHRGLKEPETLDKVLLHSIEEGGTEAAQQKYRELREEYYGMGAYNFGPRTLNTVAETIAQEKKDVDGAIALMKLNVEFNPDAAYSHLMLGQLYAETGDKDAAIASIERSLEIEPDNNWAKRMLERVKSM
ncbi:MAG: c-type cytochrome [Candidatus Latescibacterota bacterium]|nr:MAG: c-type cytochrome [Candidatus Latescibacterota bacterium]